MPGTYRINMTSRALADLTGVFNYIAQDSPDNAAKFIERLLDEIDGLAWMPSRFKRVGFSSVDKLPVHSTTVWPFVVYFRIDEPNAAVFVVEVRHGMRQRPRRFN